MKTIVLVAALPVLVAAALAWLTRRTARRIESLLPPAGRFVDVPGARLHIRESGSTVAGTPALLLVHGLLGQTAHFDYGVAEELARTFRVVAVDRPGSGHSQRSPGAGADVSAQAAALAALIKELGLERPVIVGHSLGGAVALALALEHPASVGALALVAPLTHPHDTPPAVFRPLNIATRPLRELFAHTLATPVGLVARSKVLAEVFAPEAAPPDFSVKGGGLLSLCPGRFLEGSCDMQTVPLHLPAIETRYRELSLPVGVLFGRQDAILDWRVNGQSLAEQATGAWLELVDGGHMLPVTQPGATAAFVRRVVQRAAGGQA